ncbi:MAG: FAD dependent oxidoreductase [Rhodobacteraceae bacterium]|nr:FAD-dependent oxidoreductase [Cypionkella sp.]KAF0175042.1 MAG: FAD dependent oxidoreductase [Paracoccaceae bacterium]MDO8325466.1 FAD-dependent oxidoreductase [Cypionkella sp.]
MKTDVAIISGGAIGASVAYYLKTMNPSLSVTVIERDPT